MKYMLLLLLKLGSFDLFVSRNRQVYVLVFICAYEFCPVHLRFSDSVGMNTKVYWVCRFPRDRKYFYELAVCQRFAVH